MAGQVVGDDTINTAAHVKRMETFMNSIGGKEQHAFIPWLRAQLKCVDAAREFMTQIVVFEKLGRDAPARLARDSNQSCLHAVFVAVRVMKASVEALAEHGETFELDSLVAKTVAPMMLRFPENEIFIDAVTEHFSQYVTELMETITMIDRLMKGYHKDEEFWRGNLGEDASLQDLAKCYESTMGTVAVVQVDAKLREVDQACSLVVEPFNNQM